MEATPISEIITRLRSSSSRLHKERVLKNEKDNAAWKDYLVEVYNPYIVYNKSGDKNGGRNDLDNLRLCRSVDAGITTKTINKVYPDLIPSFGVMKSLDYNKRQPKLDYPLFAGIKYDGFNTTIVVEDGKVIYYTSGGHEFKLKNDGIFGGVRDGVYLAEMIGVGRQGKLGERGYAAYQTTMRTNTKKGIANRRECNWRVFDYLTLEEFYSGKAKTPYINRRLVVQSEIPPGYVGFEKLITSPSELEEFIDVIVRMGYEGVVGKHTEMLWRNTTQRRKDFFKWKKRPTADLLCIDEVGGSGKFLGVIGSLTLKDSSGRVVNVGSGLDDHQRRAYGEYIGKVIEIEYEQIKDTYIQPVFLRVREDKPRFAID